MRAAVRYYSRSGNTKLVAEAMADSLNVTAISVDEAKQAIAKAPGCVLAEDIDGRNYPTPLDTSDQDLVYVGRVRRDLINGDKGIALWCCGDQIRKGAATNCVEIAELLATGNYIGGGAPIRFERYSLPLWCNDMMCRALFRCTGLYCGIFWAKRSVFLAVGGFVEQKAMEDAATARVLKRYGRAHGRKYTVLRRNYLINSTRKYDEMGDWLYFRLLIENAGAFLRAAAGDRSGVDALLDRLFYDYNG